MWLNSSYSPLEKKETKPCLNGESLVNKTDLKFSFYLRKFRTKFDLNFLNKLFNNQKCGTTTCFLNKKQGFLQQEALIIRFKIQSDLIRNSKQKFFNKYDGSATTPIELFGPTRYQWDLGFFQQEIDKRVQSNLASGKSLSDAWADIPEKLAFYDYIGNNPAKGGLFRTGAMNSGDGIAVGWLNRLTLLIGKLIVNRINFRKPNRFLMSQLDQYQ